MSDVERIPPIIIEAFGLGGARARHIPSNINETYVIEGAAREPSRLVLQRLHPVFGPSVNEDIDAVTTHLEACGLVTPRLVRTLSGALWTLDAKEQPWRAQTFIPGQTFHRATSPTQLESAAALLAGFHSALTTLQHRFVHHRPLHETQKHLELLRNVLALPEAAADSEAQSLGMEILRRADAARLDFSGLPRRICHGDPKLSNVMFRLEDAASAFSWLDLDTVGEGYLAYELGDALRSWCNPAGEDTTSPQLDLELFRASIAGYVSRARVRIERDELFSALEGFNTVSLELASRFARDVIEDRYWGWDNQRFASRRAHNLVRARGQLALAAAIERQYSELARALERFAPS